MHEWVIKNRETGSVYNYIAVGTQEEVDAIADEYNAQYQTDAWYAEPYDPNKVPPLPEAKHTMRGRVQPEVRASGRDPEVWRNAYGQHMHEDWQLREAPDGTTYCAACGEDVPE